jgi:hypothetical protein
MRSSSRSAICWFARPGSVSPDSFSFIIASQHFQVNTFATPLWRIRGWRSKNASRMSYGREYGGPVRKIRKKGRIWPVTTLSSRSPAISTSAPAARSIGLQGPHVSDPGKRSLRPALCAPVACAIRLRWPAVGRCRALSSAIDWCNFVGVQICSPLFADAPCPPRFRGTLTS